MAQRARPASLLPHRPVHIPGAAAHAAVL